MVTYKEVKEIISEATEYRVPVSEIEKKSYLVHDLGIDSMDQWRIFTELERRYKVELPDFIGVDTNVTDCVKEVRCAIRAQKKNKKIDEKKFVNALQPPKIKSNQKVEEAVVEVFKIVVGGEITPESKIYQDTDADSTDIIEVSMKLEALYNLENIPDDAFQKATVTVRDVASFIDEQLKLKASKEKKNIELQSHSR